MIAVHCNQCPIASANFRRMMGYRELWALEASLIEPQPTTKCTAAS